MAPRRGFNSGGTDPFEVAINQVAGQIKNFMPSGIGGGTAIPQTKRNVAQQSVKMGGPRGSFTNAMLGGGGATGFAPRRSLGSMPSVKVGPGGGFLSQGSSFATNANSSFWNNTVGAYNTTERMGRQYLESQRQAAADAAANRNNFGTSGNASAAQSDRVQGALQHKDLLMQVEKESGVPWQVLAATMALESGGQNIGTNPAGATGLMQIVGSIWQDTANKYGGDLSDPYTNVRTAADIMKANYDQYGSWEKAAAAYFGGGGAFNADGSYSSNADMYGTDIASYVNTWANNFAAINGQSASPTNMAPNERAAVAINFAKNAIGTQYVLGGESYEEGGFDCSGLVYAMYKSAGLNIPRDTAAGYANSSQRIGRGEMQPGDLIFYSFGGSEVDHVSIYIGNGQMIQASTNGGDVHIRSMDEPWYTQHETGYGRL